jgi:hypothetical protein
MRKPFLIVIMLVSVGQVLDGSMVVVASSQGKKDRPRVATKDSFDDVT